MALTKVTGDFIKAGSITQGHLHSSHGITTSHIAEGDKLFFTNARVDSRVGSLSTSNLSEGTNLYYTNARARAAISGTGSLSYNSTTGVMSFTMPAQNTSNITEGSNLYYTDARADARIAAADTGDLSEGSNLYYTNARARGAISVSGNALSYNSSTGVITSNFEESPTFSGNVVINGSTSSGNAFYVTRGSDGAVAFRITNTGEVVTQANYFYASASGVSMYVQNTAVFRGSILNDGSNAPVRIADDLTIDDDLTVTGGDITLGGTGRIQGIDTVSAGTDAANKTYVDNQVAGIVDSAPSTLDTLNELAAALGDDANFSTTVTNSIATKLPLAGGTLTGALQAQPWLFRSMANQTEYHVLDNGSLNGPSWKFRYDGATANRYVDFGYKDGNGNYTSGLKLYNNQTVSWRGTDIINASGQWTGGIASSGYNNSNWNTAYTYSQVGHLPLAGGTLTGDITINSSGLASSPLIRLNNSESSSYNHAIEAINANLTAGESEIIVIGKETNTKNAGYIGYNWAADASNNNYVTIGQWGENHIFRVYGDQVLSTVTLRSQSDVTAPIFYDSNDTNYYVNPGLASSNSTSHSARFRQSVQIGDSSTYNQNDGGWGARLIVSDNVHARIDVAQDADTVRASWFTHTGQGYSTFGTVTGHHLRLLSHNATRQYLYNGYSEESGSYRAPLFYDSNNTSYFLNPSASGGNALKTIGDWRQTTDSWSGEVGGKMQYHGNHWYIQAGGYIHFRNASGTNTFYVDQNGVGYVEEYIAGGASMRAPLFYDSANTNYYVDPAGTSRLYHAETTNGSEFIHCKHSGSDFASGTLVTTDIPANTTNGASYVIEVTGKSYSGEPPFAFKAQGYLYNNTIINHSGVSYGKHLTSTNQIKVFNHSDNKLAFWWPRISYWNSFEVRVRDAGGSGRNRALTVVNSTEPSSSKKVTTTLSQAALLGHNYGSGSLYSDRLYDQNNTGFYLDPASQSRLGSLKLDGIISGAASGCAEYGRNHAYHTSELKGYGAEFMIGAQHTELNINYRTCNNGASGHTPTTWKWRAGTSSNWSDHYMGLIQSSSSMRAPLFYDSNDTSYYVNPAGLSDFYSIKTTSSVDIAPRWDTSFYVAQSQHYYGHTSTQTMYLGEANHINIRNIADIHGQARAPIYYDRNNTAYYMHPDSTSVIVGLTMAGALQTAGSITAGSSGTSNIYMGGTSGNYFRFHTNNSHTYFDGNVGDIHWRQGSSTRFTFYMTSANMTINGSLTQNSDERVKENIVEIPNAIDKVKAMKGVYYNRTDFNTSVTKVGVLAQEVEAVLPELIVEAPDSGLKSVAYGELTAVLINAVKEQQTVIDDLKSRLETLENQ